MTESRHFHEFLFNSRFILFNYETFMFLVSTGSRLIFQVGQKLTEPFFIEKKIEEKLKNVSCEYDRLNG